MVKVIPTLSASVYANDKGSIVAPPSGIAKTNSKAKSWIVRCFKDFAANTALHGYNHIVREDASNWER